MVHLFSVVIIAVVFIYTLESAVVKTPTAVGSNTGRACSPVNCHGKVKTCPYGYQKKDGCDICKCNDPCNPVGKAKLCGPKQRCHVEKKPDGTFDARCDAATSKKGGKGGKSGPNADCNLPREIGMCRAAHPRFHYNSATKACESFTYGGCGGNGNNFKSKAECEKACKV